MHDEPLTIMSYDSDQSVLARTDLDMQTIDAVCLNPDCEGNDRLCNYAIQNEMGDNGCQQHQRCAGWVHNLDFLRGRVPDQSHNAFKQMLNTDYFIDPIGSVYYMQRYASEQWKDKLQLYFKQMKARIDDELKKAYTHCYDAFDAHMKMNKQVYHKIKNYCQNSLASHQQEHAFKLHLDYDLRTIQQRGRFIISGEEALKNKIQDIIKEIESIRITVWNQESYIDLKQRMELEYKWDELYYYTSNASLLDINNKLQQIESLFKKQCKYTADSKNIQINCFLCPKSFVSFGSKRNRQISCRFEVLKHLCTVHTQQILWKIPKTNALKISLEDLRKQIIGRNIKKVVVVDKENINNININDIPQDPNVYYLQILSQYSEKLAKTRYMVAESRRRDAADILAIIVIIELGRLRVKEVELLTKDHFGETLQQVLAQMGMDIKISRKPSASLTI